MDRIAVIGAGTMGAGVAGVFAAAGHPVTLYSRRPETLATAMEAIGSANVTPTTDLAAALERADVVSENVAEGLDLKREMFAAFEKHAPAEALLTTNTSSVPITAIAQGLANPGRVVGLHWFNPPAVMPLVEVVRGEATVDATAARAREIAAAVGKAVIEVRRDVPGFVVNRLQYALLREAVALVESGVATMEDVDRAVATTLAPRWAASGPLELMDLAGLDTVANVASVLMPELDAGTGVPDLIRDRVSRGEFGAKTGRGFYEWHPDRTAAVQRERDAVVRLLTDRRTSR